MISDATPIVLLLLLAGVGVEVGGVLIFRTLTGHGPRPSKLLAFGASGIFLGFSMFLAHIGANIVLVLGVFALGFLAYSWHLWQICKRHWLEWQRRQRDDTRR